jgi:photosystem I P700 chlorophyll a apoprotein A2
MMVAWYSLVWGSNVLGAGGSVSESYGSPGQAAKPTEKPEKESESLSVSTESPEIMNRTNELIRIFAQGFSPKAGRGLTLYPKCSGGVGGARKSKTRDSRVQFGLSGWGFISVLWSGHLVHVAIPASRGVVFSNIFEGLSTPPHPQGLSPLVALDWGVYCAEPDGSDHLFGSGDGAGTAVLTFLGGFHPHTESLWLTDIAHHHLAIGVGLIGLSFVVRVVSPSMKGSLDELPAPLLMVRTFLEWKRDSMHLGLTVGLSALGVLVSLVAQHMYALPPYAFLSSSLATQAALYVHHQYIAGFLMVGSFAHAAIFLVRDYDPEALHSKGSIFESCLRHKESAISHLSWVTLFLGFHTLGIYVHNDVAVAFGNPDAQILPEPVFAQLVQAYSGKVGYGFGDVSPILSPSWGLDPVWLSGWIDAVNDDSNALFLDIGPGDFLVHHAISLGVHTTVLILVKGALDARGSKLMPDKKEFGYSFPCDGPGRGGTCDISAWDAFYLAMFWMLNTESWLDFYWHWRHLCLWEGGAAADLSADEFASGSTFLMGWMASYLSGGSGLVINGYNPGGEYGIDSTWCWMFLFGHLVWATSFMFLISWRGYWQELIETLVWAHERTPIANAFVWDDAPVALSIVQGRLVGLAHFATGYVLVYAAFLLCGLR